jgi:hypothetical protein
MALQRVKESPFTIFSPPNEVVVCVLLIKSFAEYMQYEIEVELDLGKTDDGSRWDSNSCEIEATTSD